MPDGRTKGQSAEKQDSATLQFRVGVRHFYIKDTSKLIKRDQLSILNICEVNMGPSLARKREERSILVRLGLHEAFPILERIPSSTLRQALKLPS